MRELTLLPVEGDREPVRVREVPFGCAGLDGCRYCMAADERMAALLKPPDPTVLAIHRYQAGAR